MKTAHKRGGKETLSVYVVNPMSKDGFWGWAFSPDPDAGVLDGVVLHYKGITGFFLLLKAT
jgi:hypothetical protein